MSDAQEVLDAIRITMQCRSTEAMPDDRALSVVGLLLLAAPVDEDDEVSIGATALYAKACRDAQTNWDAESYPPENEWPHA